MSVGLQCVLSDDLKYFTRHTSNFTNGFISVSVCNFSILSSGSPKICLDVNKYNGPFISYIHKDDTFESLVARLESVQGSIDWSVCRLAVLIGKTIHHFPAHFYKRLINNESIVEAFHLSNNISAESLNSHESIEESLVASTLLTSVEETSGKNKRKWFNNSNNDTTSVMTEGMCAESTVWQFIRILNYDKPSVYLNNDSHFKVLLGIERSTSQDIISENVPPTNSHKFVPFFFTNLLSLF